MRTDYPNYTQYLYRLNINKPQLIIDFLEHKHPKLKGLCYYCMKVKRLKSIDNKYSFYYDAKHSVLDVSIKKLK